MKATFSKNDTTAKSIARDIKLFMDNACDQSHHELNLLNLSLEKFMIVMQEELVFKPSTVAEKLRRIRLAISFIIRQKDDAA